MVEYVRPPIEPGEFRDADGNLIEHGNRWASLGGNPPDDSYSVDDRPERFAPLHTVANALIDYLVSAYEVDVEEGPHLTSDLRNAPPAEETVRALRLRPGNKGSAPLSLVLTTYPGVHLCAGALFETAFPSCGCNACDLRCEDAADELEWHIFAVVGGGLTEEISGSRRPNWSHFCRNALVKSMGRTVSYKLRVPGDSLELGGEVRAKELPSEVLRTAQTTLTAIGEVIGNGNWLPWPLKTP